VIIDHVIQTESDVAEYFCLSNSRCGNHPGQLAIESPIFLPVAASRRQVRISANGVDDR
jgi:hypothetical protein